MPFKTFRLLSPAKINLFLRVTGKRKDGYHNIATLFQMIDLWDKLKFSPAENGKIKIACKNLRIPKKDNLIYKAAMALWRPGLPGVTIKVEKNIPSGAGLGGGSSNAATTLMALNKIWSLKLSKKGLMAKGLKLGADVPFFLSSPRAWATGIGEKLTGLPKAEPFHILLVKPKISVSTKVAYEKFNSGLTKQTALASIAHKPKGLILWEDTVRNLKNDLESTVLNMHPTLREVKRCMEGLGSDGVLMSGSGASMFGLFKTLKDARFAHKEICRRSWWSYLAKPVSSMKHFEKAK